MEPTAELLSPLTVKIGGSHDYHLPAELVEPLALTAVVSLLPRRLVVGPAIELGDHLCLRPRSVGTHDEPTTVVPDPELQRRRWQAQGTEGKQPGYLQWTLGLGQVGVEARQDGPQRRNTREPVPGLLRQLCGERGLATHGFPDQPLERLRFDDGAEIGDRSSQGGCREAPDHGAVLGVEPLRRVEVHTRRSGSQATRDGDVVAVGARDVEQAVEPSSGEMGSEATRVRHGEQPQHQPLLPTGGMGTQVDDARRRRRPPARGQSPSDRGWRHHDLGQLLTGDEAVLGSDPPLNALIDGDPGGRGNRWSC